MSSLTYLIFAGLVGALRGALGLLIEHPLDVLKTYSQARPWLASRRELVRELLREKGYWGFYSGLPINLARVALKQSYRYPLMIVLPILYGALPFQSVATGVTIAVLEFFILTPLERLKVRVMTYRSRGLSAFALCREVLNPGTSGRMVDLYRGSLPYGIKQILSWVTFLVVHDGAMAYGREIYGAETLPWFALILVAICEAVVNTAAIMPFDFLKTDTQKQGALSYRSLWERAQVNYRAGGVRYFYKGSAYKLVQYMLHAIMTTGLLETLRDHYR